ncbi:hypothetical protein A5724_07095 [Mycobacterium sp. ACS1612]|uniref:hypothetical protein n=1 Tax=Mycobacterium sp. ACS1612 TaxID=1834117 RepID=UPI000802400E|nr:hypothetical protein [Mycobacterium sp. ACS1612]OBF40814.1 hypothetical protein A5724_07095 [Mycobacterium sp. ACS1612]
MVGWIAMICGIVGIWLVPGLWMSAVMMRYAAGPAAWLGTRISTTLAWYVLVAPGIRQFGEAARITTLGILATTTVATAAVSLGVALGLSGRIASRWAWIVVAAIVGGGCAQGLILASRLVWSGEDRTYSHHVGLDVLIVLGCALLVVAGIVGSPKLPPVLTSRNVRTPLIALSVIAITAAALLAIGARWSPAQQMPSAFSAEQIPAPDGADLAFALTPLGPDGFELVRRADFTVYDETGRRVPVESRLELADGAADRSTLIMALPRSSQPELCGKERMDRAIQTGVPIKLTIRDQQSDLLLQAVIPVRWCTG